MPYYTKIDVSVRLNLKSLHPMGLTHPLCWPGRFIKVYCLVRRWTFWLIFHLKGETSSIGRSRTKYHFGGTLTGILAELGVSRDTNLLLLVHPVRSLLSFQIDLICLPLIFQVERATAGEEPKSPKWLESHWSILVLEQIFCPQVFEHQDFPLCHDLGE